MNSPKGQNPKVQFQYRTVGYGTSFTSQDGERSHLTDESKLFENEICVDVGGRCHGLDNCDLMVFDHHFRRDDLSYEDPKTGSTKQIFLHAKGILNYPSAAITVLARRDAIRGFSKTRKPNQTIWIVSHRNPDFDAFAAAFIVRKIIESTDEEVTTTNRDETRLLAETWRKDQAFTKAHRMVLKNRFIQDLCLLGAYAARVDQCVPDRCKRSSSLRFLFMAAQYRVRFNPDLPDATGFFDDVLSAIQQGYNPLIDAIPDQLAQKYNAEAQFIVHQELVYEKDIQRSQFIKTPICASRIPYAEWSQRIKGSAGPETPGIQFWNGDSVSPFFASLVKHEVPKSNAPHSQLISDILGMQNALDGLLICDPVCPFFKDWARQDTIHSPQGNGFRFLGISYSDPTIQFYFSLDPEFAKPNNLHLYDLWVKLQQAEDPNSGGRIRNDVLARGKNPQHGLSDPWFDGYDATILVTPDRGVRFPEKYAADADSDPTMQVVKEWASNGFYSGAPVKILRCDAHNTAKEKSISLPLSGFRENAHRHVRFLLEEQHEGNCSHPFIYAFLELDARIALEFNASGAGKSSTAFQVGRDLWRLISRHPTGTPPDFEQRHLIVESDWVAVWNRSGIAIAACASYAGIFERIPQDLEQLAKLCNMAAREEGSAPSTMRSSSEWLDNLRQSQKELVKIEINSLRPGHQVLRRLMDSMNLADISQRIAELAESYRDEEEGRRDQLIGDVLAIGAILGLFLGYCQIEEVGVLKELCDQPQAWLVWITGTCGCLGLMILYWMARSHFWSGRNL